MSRASEHTLVGLDPARILELQGIEPDPWQRNFLGARESTLLTLHRQAGKSTTTAAAVLHEAVYRPPALCLVISVGLRQALELFQKIMAGFSRLPNPPATRQETLTHVALENGSRIICLPGKEETIRSYSAVRLLALDEAARIPDHVYAAVRPMLAVSSPPGRILALTSPFGMRGWYWQAWSQGRRWRRYLQVVDQCDRVKPDALVEEMGKERAAELHLSVGCRRITPEFLGGELEDLGPYWFGQEYECSFLAAVGAVFDPAAIAAAAADWVRPLFADQLQAGLISQAARPLFGA